MDSYTVRNRIVVLRTLALLLLSNTGLVTSEDPPTSLAVTQSTSPADAMRFGEQDASRTSGGESGDLYSMGYETESTTPSNGLFSNGFTRGARHEINFFARNWVYGDTSIRVTIVKSTSSAHATYRGGEDVSATIGSASVYGDPYWMSYETENPTLSNGSFLETELRSGTSYEIECSSSEAQWDYPSRTYIKRSILIILDIFVGGVQIPVEYTSVECSKRGIRFTTDGSIPLLRVQISNVGVCGHVENFAIEGNGSGNWISAMHTGWSENWGQNWQLIGVHPEFVGQALSFRVTLPRINKCLVCEDVAPSNWQFGQTFECGRKSF